MGNEYNTAIVRNKQTGALETICLDTGDVLRPGSEINLTEYKFNYETAVLVCQKIREGATLKQIGDDPSLPSLTVIHYWRRNNASFDAEIKLARKDRAEYYHDKVLDLADDIVDKDDVPVARFKADTYKWAAEKGDPSSYGSKIEHTGSNVAPTIVVMTGIERIKPDIEVTDYENVSSTERREQISKAESGGVRSSGEEGRDETTSELGRDCIQAESRTVSESGSRGSGETREEDSTDAQEADKES